jgi:hypothetical protein
MVLPLGSGHSVNARVIWNAVRRGFVAPTRFGLVFRLV